MAKAFSIFTAGDRNDHNKMVKQLLSNQHPPLRAKSAPKRPSSANYNSRPSTGKATRNKTQQGANRPVISREDLIIDLSDVKKKNRILEENLSHLKSENQRLETEAHKQQRRIDQLLNLSDGMKNTGLSAEIRRDIEKSILVRQLKVQINNLRSEVSEKDTELETLRRNIKATHLMELENERDECIIEIQRLRGALAEAKDELSRENQRREWNNRVAGDNNDDLRREVARLSTGYQNILTNISNRMPKSRPSTAGSANRKDPYVRELEQDTGAWESERRKRPQSAGNSVPKSLHSDHVESPYLASNPHSHLLDGDGELAEHSNQKSSPGDRPTVAPVFADPLDNFGLADPESLAGIVASSNIGQTVSPSNQDLLERDNASPQAVQSHSIEENELRIGEPPVDDKKEMNAASGVGVGKFSVGMKVQGFFGGGPSWYDGTIRAINPDGTYQVRYDDGDEELYVLGTNLRPHRELDESLAQTQANKESAQQAVKSGAAPAFNVGDAIEALYYSGKTWYSGKITAVFPSPDSPVDFVYDITYDDGDRELKVPAEKIRQIHNSNTLVNKTSVTPHAEVSNPPTVLQYAVDDKVEGRFGGGSDWYKATISAAHSNNTYDLAYDDGDREYKVSSDMIRILETKVIDSIVVSGIFSVGERVKGYFDQYSQWYPGVVKSVNSDGTYHIVYDDGDEETNVQESRLQAEKSNSAVSIGVKLSVGDKVEGRFGGGSDWYKATISAAHSNNTYDLAYDDGDREYKVSSDMIRILETKAIDTITAANENQSKGKENSHPHIVNTNLDSFLNDLSDNDSTGGVDAEPAVAPNAGQDSMQYRSTTTSKSKEDEYDEDFDA